MYSSKELQTVNDFKSETTNVKDTSSTLSTFSGTSGFAIEENLWEKGELNMTYVVAGVGFFVSVLLIIIVIQLSKKKQGYAKRKALTKKTDCKPPDAGLTNQTHFKNNQTNLKASSHQQPNHLYLDPVYYELDEIAEPMEIPTYSNAITTTECDTDPLKLTYPNFLETKNEYSNSNFVECYKQEY